MVWRNEKTETPQPRSNHPTDIEYAGVTTFEVTGTFSIKKLKVLYLYRKTNPVFFSIEKVFTQIRAGLAGKIEMDEVYVPHAKLSPGNIRRNLQAVRKKRADVYHITGDVHYLALALPKRHTILTIHDCVFMYQTSGIKRWILKQLFLVRPVKHSRLITTISEQTKRDIIRFTDCPASKVVVIPNPLDGAFSFQEKSFNEQLPRILFIGSTPNKNLARTIEALKGLPCELDIVGVIPAAERLRLQEYRIRFHESSGVSSEELIKKYIACDMLLFPSTFEGFGLPVVEAQQTGRPVVTSALDPMQEVAGGGACLVDPYDVNSIREGVLRVVHDNAYRSELIKKGIANIERYQADRISAQYAEQYDKIMVSRKTSV